MSNISIRGVNSNLSSLLKERANSKGMSLNSYLLDILKTHVGLNKKKIFTQTYDDLDKLIGAWSQEEYTSINEKIISERQIDKEIWK